MASYWRLHTRVTGEKVLLPPAGTDLRLSVDSGSDEEVQALLDVLNDSWEDYLPSDPATDEDLDEEEEEDEYADDAN